VGITARLNNAVEWVKNSRPGRVLAWFWACNGGALCAGIAYQTLFSLFAILTVAWSAFSASLGRYPALQAAVLEQINSWLPGLIGYQDSAIISPDQLVLDSALNWASMVAIVMGPFWIYRVMTAIHTAICRVLAVSRRHSTRIWDQITKFLGFFVLGAGILVAAVTTILTHALGNYVVSVFGPQLGSVVSVASQIILHVIGALINGLVIMGAIRLVARVWFISEHKRRELWWGAIFGGFALELLRWLGVSFVTASASNNPLLAPFAAIVSILLLTNFAFYVILMVCAWVYNPQRLDRPRSPKPANRRERLFGKRKLVESPTPPAASTSLKGVVAIPDLETAVYPDPVPGSVDDGHVEGAKADEAKASMIWHARTER